MSLGLAGCLNKVGDELNPEQAVFVSRTTIAGI